MNRVKRSDRFVGLVFGFIPYIRYGVSRSRCFSTSTEIRDLLQDGKWMGVPGLTMVRKLTSCCADMIVLGFVRETAGNGSGEEGPATEGGNA
jgi:hypothetical protein